MTRLRRNTPLLVGCAGVAAAIAYSLIHGQAAPATAAALVVTGMVVVAWGNSTRTEGGTRRKFRAVAPRPDFHRFLVRRLGSPRKPVRLLANAFVRPLLAPSFGAFWREWNPPLGYVLLFWVYRPLRRYLPRQLSQYVVFLVSGVLHDAVANGGAPPRSEPSS